MSNKLRKKKGAGTLVWGLLLLVMIGLGGYGVSNFGTSRGAIGSVGDREIDIRDYARALNQEIRATSRQLGTQINFPQAQMLGIDRQVQARLFASAALDGEAAHLGLSVGDAEVGRQIRSIGAFQGLDGSFDRQAYELTLRQQGLTVPEFEAKMRDDSSRALLQRAILGGTGAPETFLRTVAAWRNETRDFTLSELIAADLDAPVPAPSEEALADYHAAHPEAYTRPETRNITYIRLTPEAVLAEVKPDEAKLRAAYEDRIAEFVIPEKRLVERLVFANTDEAAAAKARIDGGEASFEQIVNERGLTLADIDLGEQSEDELGAAGDAIFAMTEPGVVGPLDSPLGPALFAMNGILDAQNTSFEDARATLEPELAMDAARRVVAERSENIADVLAGGASLEDVAKETGMDLATIAFNENSEEGIAGYAAFREAAGVAATDDFPQLVELEDGGIFALRLDSIDAPALRPIAEVRDQVIADWTRDETHRLLAEKAQTIQAELDNGAALGALGLVTTRYTDFLRNGHLADAPAEVADRAFTLEPGKAAVVDAEGRIFVVGLDAIHPASDDEVAAMVEGLRPQLQQSVASDIFEMFATALQNQAGMTVDAGAINAVNAQMQ